MHNLDTLNALIALLGTENADYLKKQIADIIIARVRDDIEQYSQYLIYPPDTRESVKLAMESVEKKVIKMYKDAIIEVNQKYIDDMKKCMIRNTSDDTLRSKIYDYANNLKWQGNEYSDQHKIALELFHILEETDHGTD